MRKKKKQSEKLTENTAMSSEVEAVRSVEDLPEDNPSFDTVEEDTNNNKETKDESTTIDFTNNAFSSSSPFGQLMEKKDVQPPMYDEKTSITCYTRFESTTKASHILSRLSRVLEQMKISHSHNKKNFFIRAKCILGLGSVIFVAKVYSHPTDSSKTIVEFRRRKGDSMHYRSIYASLLEKLNDLVAKSEKEKKENDEEKSLVLTEKNKEKTQQDPKEEKESSSITSSSSSSSTSSSSSSSSSSSNETISADKK